MKLLHHGEFTPGSNTAQRAEEFERRADVDLVRHPVTSPTGPLPLSLTSRVLWKLRLPTDVYQENERLLAAAERVRPDVILVENSKVLSRSTLARLRRCGSPVLAFISSDDIVAPHNLSWPLKWSFP